MAEKYVLMDLNDEKSKDIATVLSSKSAKKILDFLSECEGASETDISDKLSIPISTVHYNLSVLIKAKLVEAKEFHYSKKGREINHYSLAKKLIIIAPSGMDNSVKDRLKNLFLSIVFGILFVGTSVFMFFKNVKNVLLSTGEVSNAAFNELPRLAKTAPGMFGATAESAPMMANDAAYTSTPFLSFENPVVWLIIGIVIGVSLVLFICFLVKFIKSRRTQ
ncbi:MAG: helix-turn-helix domain-containing protein [Candidatus Woesearchaeota archaeon]|jgi:DNA-binding transcriptional ArsR family regulator